MPPARSRFTVLFAPVASPGCCFLCKGITAPFIDTQLSVKFHGSVIICINCVTDMFNQLPTGPIDDNMLQGADYAATVRTVSLSGDVFNGLKDDFIKRLWVACAGVNPAFGVPAVLEPPANHGTVIAQEIGNLGNDTDAGKAGNTVISEGPDSVSDDSGNGDLLNL